MRDSEYVTFFIFFRFWAAANMFSLCASFSRVEMMRLLTLTRFKDGRLFNRADNENTLMEV